jgi:uncharacterized membrane protein HdeD (DUF308 family)
MVVEWGILSKEYSMYIAQLNRNAGWLALKGLVGLVFGIWALFMTRYAFSSLALLAGIYMIIDGLCSWISSTAGADTFGLLTADGIVTLIAGIVSLVFSHSPEGLVWVWFAWALITGILELGMAGTLEAAPLSAATGLAGALAIGLCIALGVTAGATVVAWALCLGVYGVADSFCFLGMTAAVQGVQLNAPLQGPRYRSNVQPDVTTTTTRVEESTRLNR